MPVALQAAGSSDIEALVPLCRDYYAYDGHDFDEASARSGLSALLDDPAKGQVWLILCAGEIAGYAVLCFGYSLEYGRDAFLDELFLRREFRGQGRGREAMVQIERETRRLGCRALHLQIMAGNTRAESLYRSLGYDERNRLTLSKRLS